MEENNNITPQGESKAGVGVICGLFLGLIGLIIGLLLYKDGSYERQTFIKAWVITFVVEVAIGFVLWLILFLVGMSAVSSFI